MKIVHPMAIGAAVEAAEANAGDQQHRNRKKNVVRRHRNPTRLERQPTAISWAPTERLVHPNRR
jgi:hypothetical protein